MTPSALPKVCGNPMSHQVSLAPDRIPRWDSPLPFQTDIDMHPISEFKSKSGLKRIFSAFFYSLDGLKCAWRQEHAFRQELFLLAAGSAGAMILPLSSLERLALIAPLVLVLMVELVNSAIESVVDRVSLERHPLSKNAKDLGSAAVLLAMALALITWGVVLTRHYL